MMNCRPGKPFPAEDKIGEFLDKSKNGVVFMSFGSVIKASVMPIENKDIILKVFARFPQYDFIWKWEEELPNAPKNVLGMNHYTFYTYIIICLTVSINSTCKIYITNSFLSVSDWLPQQDILAHPNLKVFITHAGQSSMQELLCHQKPALAVPVQGDQPLNAKELVRMEVGLSVPYPSLNEDDLYQVIHTNVK